MKKITKVLAVLSVAAVATAGVATLAACNNGESYNGEYHYNSHSTEYGIKVKVTVKDGKITKVEKVASDYVECSAENATYGWTAENIKNWNDNIDNLLKAYEGKTVAEVKALTVVVDETGVPAGKAEQTTWGDSSLCITDATQGSGRVLKAVQDALKDVE